MDGLGHFIHTYKCDGDPIPSYEGDPTPVKPVSYTHLKDTMKIAVVPNLKKEKAKACTDEVLSILAICGCEFFVKTDLFNEDGVYTEAVEPELCDCDMFIAVGGDGTKMCIRDRSSMIRLSMLISAAKKSFLRGSRRG